MKPIDVKPDSYAECSVDFNENSPKFKIGDHGRISKYENIFAKAYAPNWSEEGFVISKTKNTVPWTYIINDLNGEEIFGTFYKKELQKTNQEEFRMEKVIKKKKRSYMSNGKVMIILLIAGLKKIHCIKMSQYFSKPYRCFGGNINVKVDLSNYATKADLKNATGVDTSKLAAKSDLASLKAEVDKIVIGKLKTVPVDLSKLSNVVNKDTVQKLCIIN